VLAVTALPYVYARASTPSNLVYTGLMFDVPDHAQYWSWITASHDSVFISNTMTPEDNAAIFANPPMWALAQAQAIFGLSFPVLFQWWRVVAIGLLVPALVAFVGAMLPEHERRTTALVIALLGSTPIGGPLVGWVSEEFGPRWGFALGGIATIVGVLAFGTAFVRARRRDASVEMTVVPDELVLGIDGESIPASIR